MLKRTFDETGRVVVGAEVDATLATAGQEDLGAETAESARGECEGESVCDQL